MVGNALHIIAIDPETGEIAWECRGPDERGACGRVAIGDEMPCIGKALTDADADDEPYVVPPCMTLCPVTLSLAMGVHMGRSRVPQETAA